MNHTPKYEVLSLRMTPERLALLERHRRAIADERHRPVSLSESVVLALDDRAGAIDRQAARAAQLRAPTDALRQIRTDWESQHTLTAAQWDVLADYVKVGADEARVTWPQRPLVPSRDSYLTLLDAFEAVYLHRVQPRSPQTWAYFANLGGLRTSLALDAIDVDQRHHTVMTLLAQCRDRVQPLDHGEPPWNIGHCFSVAVRDEGVDSTTLNQLLAPHWPMLWRLAARGHWIRHNHQPIPLGLRRSEDDPWRSAWPPEMTGDDVAITVRATLDAALTMRVAFTAHRVVLDIIDYPELVEFHRMLESDLDAPWQGTAYVVTTDPRSAVRTLWLVRRHVHLYLSATEWASVRDVLGRAWQHPDLQWRLVALQAEYGEHG